MKVKQIISKSRSGNKMEVIGKEDDTQKTLHIHEENKVWKYFAGCDKTGRKVFSPITVEVEVMK
jgi:hypothetical protein